MDTRAHNIREAVFTALSNAIDNGYDMSKHTVAQIASDLGTYDVTLEGLDFPELHEHILAFWTTSGLRLSKQRAKLDA